MQAAHQDEADEAPSPLAERILGAAFAAFMAHGYAGASTLEIATRAKVSKRELYALFGSKQEMLRACIATRTRRMRPPEPPAGGGDAASELAILDVFGARLVEELSAPSVVAVNRLAIVEAVNSPEIAEEMNAVRLSTRGAIADILRRAQAAGGLGVGDPDEMAGEFFSLLMRDLTLRLMQRTREAPDAEEAAARARSAVEAIRRLHPPA